MTNDKAIEFGSRAHIRWLREQREAAERQREVVAQVWRSFVCPFDFCDITYEAPDDQPPTCNGETGGESRSGYQPSGRWHRPVPMVRQDESGAA